jgi:hypothetical protein
MNKRIFIFVIINSILEASFLSALVLIFDGYFIKKLSRPQIIFIMFLGSFLIMYLCGIHGQYKSGVEYAIPAIICYIFIILFLSEIINLADTFLAIHPASWLSWWIRLGRKK